MEQRAISGLTLAQVDERLGALAGVLEPVTTHFVWRPQVADADDEMVFDAALNGWADALVAFNLRDLVAARRFDRAIIRAGEVLEASR